jgi:hypothetical protein
MQNEIGRVTTSREEKETRQAELRSRSYRV